MNRMLPLLIAATLWIHVSAGGQEMGPASPEITNADGTALVTLARQTMAKYIERRVNVETMVIPEELKHLDRWNYVATVTLRRDGVELSRVTHSGRKVCQNVVAAALEAMRSPRLDDRITKDVLEGLTVEVEVHGPLASLVGDAKDTTRPVAPAQFEAAVIPGYTGLKVSRGLSEAYVLPSMAYVEGLTAQLMRQECMTQVRLSNENMNMPWRWSTFLTSHFVGYGRGDSEGMVVCLFRGKMLIPFKAITEQHFADGALAMAGYLAANQGKDGRYALAEEERSVRDHLYATYVLAQLARRTGNKAVAASVQNAMAFGVSQVARAGGRTFVKSERQQDQVACTAMLAAAIPLVADGQKLEPLRKELLATLKGAIGADGSLPARLDGPAGSKVASIEDGFWVQTAIEGALADEGMKKSVSSLRAWLGTRPCEDVADALWKLRARLPLEAGNDRALLANFVQMREEAASADRAVVADHAVVADQRGGFAGPDGRPLTQLTALAAMNLSEGRLWRQLTATTASQVETMRELRQSVWQARCFCYTMMYRRYEAFFAKSPATWVGAVRVSPASARVSLAACAAAMEAMLIQQSPEEAIPE